MFVGVPSGRCARLGLGRPGRFRVEARGDRPRTVTIPRPHEAWCGTSRQGPHLHTKGPQILTPLDGSATVLPNASDFWPGRAGWRRDSLGCLRSVCWSRAWFRMGLTRTRRRDPREWGMSSPAPPSSLSPYPEIIGHRGALVSLWTTWRATIVAECPLFIKRLCWRAESSGAWMKARPRYTWPVRPAGFVLR